MNQSRSKKVRFAVNNIRNTFPEETKRACEDKFNALNRHGEPQHRRINPLRQIKKMVMREGVA